MIVPNTTHCAACMNLELPASKYSRSARLKVPNLNHKLKQANKPVAARSVPLNHAVTKATADLSARVTILSMLAARMRHALASAANPVHDVADGAARPPLSMAEDAGSTTVVNLRTSVTPHALMIHMR